MNIEDHVPTIMKGIKQVQRDNSIEMEAVFKQRIDTKTFNRIIGYLKGKKDVSLLSTLSSLDISIPEMKDNMRYTIYGDASIHSYCKSNNLNTLRPNSYSLMRKTQALKTIYMNEYGVNINFKREEENQVDLSIFNEWPQLKKTFRYKKRYSFRTDDNLFSFDLTVLKSSNTKIVEKDSKFLPKKKVDEHKFRHVVKPKNVKNKEEWFESLKDTDEVEIKGTKYPELIPSRTIQSSNVLRNELQYEVEIEYIGNKQKHRAKFESILEKFKGHIEMIMKSIQNSPFIISRDTENMFMKEYKKLMNTFQFSAPQPIALEMKHVNRRDYGDYPNILSIRRNYCVTDKADGERFLLLVLKNGECAMINRTNEVRSLGCSLKGLEGTVMDGEYLLTDKDGNPMIMFAVFDIYFKNGEDLRKRVFNRSLDEKEEGKIPQSRYEILTEIFADLDLDKGDSPLVFTLKKFLFGNVVDHDEDVGKEIMRLETELKNFSENDAKYRDLMGHIDKLRADTLIFEHSKTILENDYPYRIDGLIYTPISLEVGGSFDTGKGKPFGRWFDCFKWKPPMETTIDFKVIFRKDPKNPTKDLTEYLTEGDDIHQYKIATLCVGYDPEKHTKHNSTRVLNEELTYKEGYNLVPFYPSCPYRKDIETCMLRIVNGETKTENGEIIKDNAIVEFRFNKEKSLSNAWEPVRVRNVLNPNDFITAINNWKTLFAPVTEDMIKTGDTPNSDEPYYIRKQERKAAPTKPLGDFHSYVKKNLIVDNSKKAKILVDPSSGKGGDINHWIDSDVEYIVAMDINRDNIHNENNGSCNRILNLIGESENIRKLKNTMVIWGDAQANMKTARAANDDLNRYYLDVLYGNANKDLVENSKLQRLYGILKDGADVFSCQFTVHYFFENIGKLGRFLQNVSENLKPGGKFIGTTMDGKKLFERLQSSTHIYGEDKDEILWKVIKKYDSDRIKLGLEVDVYVHSIGQLITEYLVDFDLFEQEALKYDLKLVENVNFSEVFSKFLKSGMEYGAASTMNSTLQELSFMYNYFVFEKI